VPGALWHRFGNTILIGEFSKPSGRAQYQQLLGALSSTKPSRSASATNRIAPRLIPATPPVVLVAQPEAGREVAHDEGRDQARARRTAVTQQPSALERAGHRLHLR
jgi:hypothetical protein